MKPHPFINTILKIALFISIIAVVFCLGNTVYESTSAQTLVHRFGYVGVFILSLAALMLFFHFLL